MSLSDEFKKVINKMNVAIDWCDNILNHEVAMENKTVGNVDIIIRRQVVHLQ